MPRKGLYLTIGVNKLDITEYGDPGTLGGCENDARDMAHIAERQNFTGATLLSEDATSDAVLTALEDAANALESDDIFLLTFSGHGGQIPDTNGDGESDALDETWCLYDRQLIDDELYAMWSKFRAGVRIFVLSDSCNSGTVTKKLFWESTGRRLDLRLPSDMTLALTLSSNFTERMQTGPRKKIKGLPLRRSMENYERNKAAYDRMQQLVGPSASARSSVAASIILISGCQDGESSFDNGIAGEFTNALKTAWADDAFVGSYRQFYEAIVAGDLDPKQNPKYYCIGAPNPAFEVQRPFTI